MEHVLVCPDCKAPLRNGDSDLACSNADCSSLYPVINGVPILINERVSTFRLSEYFQTETKLYSRFREKVRAIMPRITGNFAARRNFQKLAGLLLERAERPSVLIVGGAEVGDGLAPLLDDPRFEILETDVALGRRTKLVCDARFLPFPPSSFDAVIIQAVLEYVPDPVESVSEIYRVLRPDGLIYSEMPFIQDVHGGRYDFTRLTLLGHRRLYRNFAEIASGSCAGPATALSWTLQQLFLSCARSRIVRDLVKLGMSCSMFWLKYFDLLLMNTPGGVDGAAGTYFLGKKSEEVLSDHDLIGLYRGGVPSDGVI